MNKDSGPHDDLDPLLREALGWVVRLTSGTATQADAHAFARWRAQGQAHEAALREATAFRAAVRAMDLPALRNADDCNDGNVIALASRRRPPVMNRRALLAGSGAIAVSAAAVMVTRPPLGLWPSFAELTADYRTGMGERRQVALADGAHVELNARSALSLLGNRRGVDLVAGEAFVTLAPARTDFIVEARGQQFRAREARFNIRTGDLETCAACLSGTVSWKGPNGTRTLHAGQQLSTAPGGAVRVAAIDAIAVGSWRQGLLVFRNTPLAVALEDINRYGYGRIVLTDSALAERPVNGVFHTDQAENAVAQIQQLLGLGVRHLPGGVVLMG